VFDIFTHRFTTTICATTSENILPLLSHQNDYPFLLGTMSSKTPESVRLTIPHRVHEANFLIRQKDESIRETSCINPTIERGEDAIVSLPDNGHISHIGTIKNEQIGNIEAVAAAPGRFRSFAIMAGLCVSLFARRPCRLILKCCVTVCSIRGSSQSNHCSNSNSHYLQ
jgi:hypothetical protein